MLSVTNASTGVGYGIYSAMTATSNTGYAGYFASSSTGFGYALYATMTGQGNTGYAGYFNNSSGAGAGYAYRCDDIHFRSRRREFMDR